MNNNQRDPRWANVKLGFSNTTIGDYGCTISAIGNILGVTPVVVNDRMKAVGGFAEGNLVIWSAIEKAFPGVKIRRVWNYNNDDVKANTPNVIVEVNAAPIGSPRGSHWVQYLGNQRLNDPWTGRERPTSDFPNPTGYCVITGKWEGGGNVAGDYYKGLDLNNKDSMRACVDIWEKWKNGGFVEKSKYDEDLRKAKEQAASSQPATNTEAEKTLGELKTVLGKVLK